MNDYYSRRVKEAVFSAYVVIACILGAGLIVLVAVLIR